MRIVGAMNESEMDQSTLGARASEAILWGLVAVSVGFVLVQLVRSNRAQDRRAAIEALAASMQL